MRPTEGLSFWRDAVCHAVLNVSAEASRERFRATISGQQFGAMRFAAFTSTPHTIVREAAHVNLASEDHYLISLQRRGRSGLDQGDRPFWLYPGEIAIMDGMRPFRVAFPGMVSRVLAVVPRHLIDSRAPWIRCSRTAKIAASSPYADLVRRHMNELASGLVDALQAQLLTDNLCNLLALATAPAKGEIQSGVQMQAIFDYCRRHLGDASLSPARVAAHFGFSVHTLHLRFESTGRSFRRWMLEARLQECRRVLVDPAQQMRTISEIAFTCGFGDLSHFSKSFRARFGETPRDLRKGL